MFGNALCRLRANAAGRLAVAALGAAFALPIGAIAQEGPALACQQLVAALANDGRVALQGVHFDFNRASLRPDSLPALIAARDAILSLGGAWSFEGHTDSIGTHAYNQSLSEARALSVRDWMIGAGIDAAQVSHAGFSFDRPLADNATEAGRALNRRVELVGMVTPDMLGFGGPEGADPCPDTLTPGTHAATATGETPPPPPPITEWSGAAGQEWLPFSYFMATGDGVEGWDGASIILPRGSQPQACQALCMAEERCAGFGFMPFGSNFVQETWCTLHGYGGERFIARDNSYYEGGTFHVTGLKPDARLLTAEAEAVAAQILADMAELAELRARVRLSAPSEALTRSTIEVALDGHVPPGLYTTYVEIAEIDDFNFDWRNSRAGITVGDMADGRSGRIDTPAPGSYMLRYVIDHPTAGRHMLVAQPLTIHDRVSGATLDVAGSVAPGAPFEVRFTGPAYPGDWIDMVAPGDAADMSGGLGWDYAVQSPVTLHAPHEPGRYLLRYVAEHPSDGRVVLASVDLVIAPEGAAGVMAMPDQASAPEAAGSVLEASLSAPMVVAPGEVFVVDYAGPLMSGDWIDMIPPGNEDDMSGGLGWAWATGAPVTLTAPASEGVVTLRYVAQDPERGRVVLARSELRIEPVPPETVAVSEIYRRCESDPFSLCEIALPAQDVALTLMGGFGITEPLRYETAGGVVAERPSFDVVRLSDGVVVMTVNARQSSGVYCQEGVSGDHICLTPAFDGADGMIAAVVFGSLASHDLHQQIIAGGAQEITATSPLEGIWSLEIHDGPASGTLLMRLELGHLAGGADVWGDFQTAPDFALLPRAQGAVQGRLAGESLSLILTQDDGRPAPTLALTLYGSADYIGTLTLGEATESVRLLYRSNVDENWQAPLSWFAPGDGMADALRLGAAALLGGVVSGDGAAVSDEDRAFMEMLGRVMDGAAETLGDGALGRDATALLGQLFGTPQAPATAGASPQMQALEGRALDIAPEELDFLLDQLLPQRGI